MQFVSEFILHGKAVTSGAIRDFPELQLHTQEREERVCFNIKVVPVYATALHHSMRMKGSNFSSRTEFHLATLPSGFTRSQLRQKYMKHNLFETWAPDDLKIVSYLGVFNYRKTIVDNYSTEIRLT